MKVPLTSFHLAESMVQCFQLKFQKKPQAFKPKSESCKSVHSDLCYLQITWFHQGKKKNSFLLFGISLILIEELLLQIYFKFSSSIDFIKSSSSSPSFSSQSITSSTIESLSIPAGIKGPHWTGIGFGGGGLGKGSKCFVSGTTLMALHHCTHSSSHWDVSKIEYLKCACRSTLRFFCPG